MRQLGDTYMPQIESRRCDAPDPERERELKARPRDGASQRRLHKNMPLSCDRRLRKSP